MNYTERLKQNVGLISQESLDNNIYGDFLVTKWLFKCATIEFRKQNKGGKLRNFK